MAFIVFNKNTGWKTAVPATTLKSMMGHMFIHHFWAKSATTV